MSSSGMPLGGSLTIDAVSHVERHAEAAVPVYFQDRVGEGDGRSQGAAVGREAQAVEPPAQFVRHNGEFTRVARQRVELVDTVVGIHNTALVGSRRNVDPPGNEIGP